MTDTLTERFADLFGAPPEFVVQAPGRVNLIGEHTDYNDGFVFPAAIDYHVTMAGSTRPDRQVRAYSLTFNQSSTFSLDSLVRSEGESWSNYIRGVAAILQDEGRLLRGMNLLIQGTVPMGSGLSSSAAMEVASSLAFEASGGFDLDPVKRALICQRAEREFVGVNCGIMDQFISALGKRDHALLIDTRTLDCEAVPLPESGIAIVLADTNKPRGLVTSEYNTRRAECEEAVTIFQQYLPGVRALRDVESEELEQWAGQLPAMIRKRARHVIHENAHVLASVTALKAGDVARFGELMNESHESLRDDYEVSCFELDVMADAARKVPGVFGSRMTGAGFGGCTVSLVEESAVPEFELLVGSEYTEKTGRTATFHVCHASDGARRIA